ncbi:eukaryotic translation initiation factor 4G [Actinidia rufa]|uniref:Eukaryotic translation initiation factor 4G n=1 Tax=Actinidia rufa TaxID=165716 RepID=A0A7J0EV86_9ERIC|nr:eukaryotic translation initiation factor 4G [Actinidia rufa]
MSHNQSRFERSDSSQYRKSGQFGGSAQARNFSGGGRKGGGTAPPPASSSLASNWSIKKSNNVQGGQTRVTSASLKSDSNDTSVAQTLQNGSHLQPPVHGAADARVTGTVKPTTDMATWKNAQVVPKAPSSQPAAVSSDTTTPATPTKAPGDASESFTLQFGSISPGFMNGMQIPARTNSAPPNLDEQKRHQARLDSSRAAVPTFPIPSVPKKQIPRKDEGAGDQSNTGVVNQMSKAKRDVQISSAPAVTQTQPPSVHPIPGVSMPMPFHQPQVPVQFGGSNAHIQSQGITAISSLPMPFPMGNAPQLQQQVFVPSMQPHPMQTQGIMHQGQNMNFTSQMGPQLPPQLGNLGVNMGPQFTQQQAGKYGSSRKPIKITHPDTHEELRLDGGLSGPRSHPNVPQSQPMTSVPPHPINYYPNSLYFPGPGPVPLTSNQINPSSQAPRFSYPVSQGPQSISFLNPSVHNSYPNKFSTPMHGIAEPSSLEHSRDGHNAICSAPSPKDITFY